MYNLPIGTGKRWLSGTGWASHLIGGWRIGAVQSYISGTPIGVTVNDTLPIFNLTERPTVTTDNWLTPYSGSFDPNKETYLNAAAFPAQSVGVLGNAPRLNSQVRNFPTLNENVSLAKTFRMSERFRLGFGAEVLTS